MTNDRPLPSAPSPLDAAAADALRADALDRPSPPPSPAARGNWTIAIDLAASQDGADGGGANNQKRRLEELAAKTEGSSVSFVVQVTEPIAPQHSSKGGDSTYGGKERSQPATVDRFLMQNGHITSLENGAASRGLANDVTDLLREAGQVAPANNIGLIVQSHGGAADGLEGDSGSASLSDFTHAVTTGLAGSGHSKLNLLDFDSCSMGNLNVAESVAPIADQMIASSEVESSGRHSEYDGQNLQVALSGLLTNPNMSAGDLAKSMITQADAGANDGYNTESKRMQSGTPTLGHFDLSQVDNFNHRLNDLGGALSNVLADPAQRAAVNDIIKSVPLLPKGGMEVVGNPGETRDLKSFAETIVRAAQDGRIKSPEVRQAAENVLAAENQLIPQYHGAKSDGYDSQGGMTAFLPDLRLLDTSNQEVASNTSISQLDSMSSSDNEYVRNFENKGRAGTSLTREIDKIKEMVGDKDRSDIERLYSDAQAIGTASDAVQYGAAIDHLHADTQTMLHSQLATDLVLAENTRTRDRQYSEQALPLTGWQQFLDQLSRVNH